MTAAVVEMKKNKIARELKPRVEVIQAKDVVDVFRLFQKSTAETRWEYPSLDEENGKDLVCHLYNLIASPTFVGLMIKVGRKPVGYLFGQVMNRPFGKPRNFFFVWDFYVEPELRKKGLMKQMTAECFSIVKQMGVHHWEMNASEKMAESICAYAGHKTEKLYQRIGGKIL